MNNDKKLPISVNCKIPIVLSADENYARQMYITMLSILENKYDSTQYAFYLLVPQLFAKEREQQFLDLSQRYSNTSVNFIVMGDTFRDLDVGIAHITFPAYYRLKIGELFKAYDKAIYLDVDIIVEKDLSDLFNIDLGENYVAGVYAASYVLFSNHRLPYYNAIGLSDLKQYINSGVTVWNIRQINNDNLTPKLCELSEMNLVDQDIINLAFYNNILHLPLKFNMQIKYKELVQQKPELKYKQLLNLYGEGNVREALEDPVIIHYADKHKPWNSNKVMFLENWWKYAKLSPFYNELKQEYERENSILKHIFSVKNVGGDKVVTICGLRLKFKSGKH